MTKIVLLLPLHGYYLSVASLLAATPKVDFLFGELLLGVRTKGK